MVNERPDNSIRPDLPEFTCKNWEPARGGWIALVDCDKECPRRRDADVGDVMVDGYVRKCEGVEFDASDGPIKKGERIRLLLVGNQMS
jgi:hypothetical protein